MFTFAFRPLAVLLVMLSLLVGVLPTQAVPASAAVMQVLAQDGFGRTVASGWGTAATGGDWSACTGCSVSGGSGRLTLAKGAGTELLLSGVASTDTDIRSDFTSDRAATGGGTYFSLVARGSSGNGYRGKARLLPNGTVELYVVRMQAWKETILASTKLPAGTFVPGVPLTVRMVATGTSPTALRMKVWTASQPEPDAWQLSASDSTSGLQQPGTAGLFAFVSSSATNGPALVTVDNILAQSTIAPNVAPTAAFTASTTDLTVALDARNSTDSDGTISSYTWTLGDGTTKTGAQISHTYATAGDYPVKLTVTDNKNATDTTTKTVTATAPNVAPTAAFTASTTDLTVALDARNSTDSDGTISSYTWTLGDGTTKTGAQISHTYATAGDYPVKLTVTDNKNATDTTTKTVTATAPNVAPTAAFTASTTDLTVALDARNSTDSDGTISSYTWTLGDGTTKTGAQISHTYATAGDYPVKLTVTDNKNATDATTKTVTATAPNVAPTAAFTASTTDLTVALDARNSTDPDGTIAAYTWTLGDGTTKTGAQISHTYATAGDYPVKLTVTDNKNATDATTKTVTATAPNVAPTAAFTASTTDLTVALDARNSTDPDGTIAAYTWTLGDGTTKTGAQISHTYATAGDYPVKLTVTDNKNATDATTKTVTATAPVVARKVGAQLPISYDVASIPASAKFVAPDGNNSTGTGTRTAPFATVQKAIDNTAAGGTVIVRGGTYAVSGTFAAITKANVTVKAYPGETPIFDYTIDGSRSFTTEGSLRYASYVEMPRASGLGMAQNSLPQATFAAGVPTGLAADRGFACVGNASPFTITAPASQTSTGCPAGTTPRVVTGFYPDQAWVNGTKLVQVSEKGKVTAGKFYVDDANNRIYLASTDSAAVTGGASWRTSNGSQARAHGLLITTTGVTVSGLEIRGFSSTWGYTPIYLNETSGGNTIDSVSITDAAAQAIHMGGTTGNVIDGATLRNSSVTGAAWVGMITSYIDDLTVSQSEFRGTNSSAEFDSGPVSGAIKLSKAARTRIVGNDLIDNVGHTLWFDQSCYKAVVAKNRITGSSHSSVFYEISHGLTLVDNFLKAGATSKDPVVRLASAGDLKMVNNTLLGGANSVAMISDPRSGKYDSNADGSKDRWCAEHAYRYDGSSSFAACDTVYNDILSSDFDRARSGAYGASNQTPGMDWQMDVLVMVNNVMADPKGGGDTNTCNADTNICIRTGQAFQLGTGAWGEVITRDSQIGGNLYDNNAQLSVLNAAAGTYTPYSGLTAWRAALTANPVSNATAEGSSVAGSGLVSSEGAVTVTHSDAKAVPTDAAVNEFVPAGTRHFGWLG